MCSEKLEGKRIWNYIPGMIHDTNWGTFLGDFSLDFFVVFINNLGLEGTSIGSSNGIIEGEVAAKTGGFGLGEVGAWTEGNVGFFGLVLFRRASIVFVSWSSFGGGRDVFCFP